MHQHAAATRVFKIIITNSNMIINLYFFFLSVLSWFSYEVKPFFIVVLLSSSSIAFLCYKKVLQSVHYRNSKVYWHLLKQKKNTLHIICMYIHKWFYFFWREHGGAKERDKKDKYSLKVMKWKLRLMDTWIKVNAFCGLRCSIFFFILFQS